MKTPAAIRLLAVLLAAALLVALWAAWPDSAALAQLEGGTAPPTEGSGGRYSAVSAARGEMLYFQMSCDTCHGDSGIGGVFVPNYAPGRIPALDGMAARMGVGRPVRARQALVLLEAGVPPESLRDTPPFADYDAFLAELGRIRTTILAGRHTAAVDVEGDDPVDMPAWGDTLTARDADALIAYFVSRALVERE